MTELERQQDEKGRFLPGNSGFGGRPKGARNKLGEAFVQALHDDFEAHGIEAIQKTRDEKPDQYLKVIASLLPKDVNLNITDDTSEMSDDELAERIHRLTAAVAPFLDRRAGSAEEAASAASAPRVH
ncbi:MAG TPA: hypothetical protein VF635_06715 [Propionibacteriaceae bacterium]